MANEYHPPFSSAEMTDDAPDEASFMRGNGWMKEPPRAPDRYQRMKNKD